MSETTRLGVSITATNTATPSVRELETSIKGLEKAVESLNRQASAMGGAARSAIEQEIAATRNKIGALNQEIVARGGLTAAMRAQHTEAQYLNRDYDLIAAKARQTAEVENQALAAKIAKTREAIAANNARVYAEQAAEDRLAAQAARRLRQEAEFEERSRQAAYSQAYTMARLENTGRDALSSKMRAEGEYENRNRDLAYSRAYREAQYENRDRDMAAARATRLARINDLQAAAMARQVRQEADYENRDRDLQDAKLSRKLAYEQKLRNEEYDRQYREANYINRDMDIAARRQQVAERAAFDRAYREARIENEAFDRARASRGGIMGILGRPQMARHGVSIGDALMRDQRGQAFASIGAAMRDAGLGAGMLTAGLAGMVALMGTAAIMRSAEQLGRWATEARAAASASGMSIEKYTALQGALSLSGMKADEANSALRRLAQNISSALEDPTSKAAQGFQALGISQEQLAKTGGDVDQVLKLLADAFVHTADGANKTAAMEAVAGRGFETLVPLLQNGANGLEQAEQKAKAFGLTLDEKTAKSLEETGQAVVQLGEHIRGAGIKSMEAWGPVIQSLAHGLEHLVDLIGFVVSGLGKLAAIAGVGGQVGSYLAGKVGSALGYPSAEAIAGADAMRDRYGASGSGGKAAVPAMSGITIMEKLRNEIAAAKAGATGGTSQALHTNALEAEIKVIRRVLEEEKLSAKQREDITTELNNKLYELHSSQATAGATAAKQSYKDFAEAEKLKIAEAQGSAAKIKAIYEEWASAAANIYKQHASTVLQIQREMTQALNAERLKELSETERTQDNQTRLMLLNSRLAGLMAGGGSRTEQRSQGPAMDFARAQQARDEAAQVEALAQRRVADRQAIVDSSIQGSETQKQAQQEIEEILVRSKGEEIRLYQEAADATGQAQKKILEPFLHLADSVGNRIENFTSSIFAALVAPQHDIVKRGLTSINVSQQGNEIRAAFRSVFLGVAGDFAKSMQSAIGSLAARALSGGASNTMGDLIGHLLEKGFTNLFPSLAGSLGGGAAGGAITAAPIVGAVTAGSGAIVGAVGASTTAIVAAITANTLKPSFAGFSFSSGGIVPSAAGGMIVGGSGGVLARLHEREMVLPAQLSQGLQSLISRGTGGGPSNNATLNYAPTINTGARSRSGSGMTRAEFAQLMGLHGGAMLGEARNMVRNGWRPSF